MEWLNYFESYTRKNSKTHEEEIEDILLEYLDSRIFKLRINAVHGGKNNRSFMATLSVDHEVAEKFNLLKSVKDHFGGDYYVIDDNKARVHLLKYYESVKNRLERFNYFTYKESYYDLVNRSFCVIYRRNKFK